ncbi:MAG: MdtA/MuxA family multidrug efflux RND transporter periplasmic adaptor subunit [Syntrophobacterales bacterium]|nr:MdtA/MuxA family multidrug efflux RND transporter periplasmic adaptor subunit [Syntrophobacterales bacterium]
MEETDKQQKSAEAQPVKMRFLWWIVLLVACLLGAGIYILLIRPGTAQDQIKQAPMNQARIVPVTAMAARKGDFGIYVSGLGTVTPVYTVTVKTRIDGQLMDVYYREGQLVKKGDLIAQIDPRPFEVQLAQAEGQLARDQAFLANARVDATRYRTLWQQDSVSKQQLDTQESLVRQYEGTVKIDQAAISNAKLQLAYCRVTAPISGRIGLRLVDPGNIVRVADTNGLIVITQLQPIAVTFPIPEDHLQQVLRRYMAGAELSVEAFDREQKQKLAIGTLLTIDNQIDTSTGTVKLKATFHNKQNELFPNQFVNVRLLVDVRRGVTIVPLSAIQRGPQGTFVYVVKEDRTVTVRPVGMGEVQGGDAVITTGILPGEMVVTDGAERLREGIKVDLRDFNKGVSPKGR